MKKEALLTLSTEVLEKTPGCRLSTRVHTQFFEVLLCTYKLPKHSISPHSLLAATVLRQKLSLLRDFYMEHIPNCVKMVQTINNFFTACPWVRKDHDMDHDQL